MTSSDLPSENLAVMREMIAEAAAGGARLVLTPEVCNCVSLDRAHQERVLSEEADDPTLAGLRETARRHGLWLVIGSLALKAPRPGDARFANRSFVVAPDGAIAARYDKIHMFDVDLGGAESFRESEGFRPGSTAVLAPTPLGRIGLSICYDLRFPALYRRLAKAGAEILTVPAAFSPVTGAAHWEILLRARAIETGCFVLAPAQCGRHTARSGRQRETWGHSLVVGPWGEVLARGGSEPEVIHAEIDIAAVARARARVSALSHDRPFRGPRGGGG